MWMIMVLDYSLYFVFCLIIYKLMNVVFKSNAHIEAYDFFGVGFMSLLMYMWLYTHNGFFMLDGMVVV